MNRFLAAVVVLVVSCQIRADSALVACADEPEAVLFLDSVSDPYTAGTLASSDKIFDDWLSTLPALKKRLPIVESPSMFGRYVAREASPEPIENWDGKPFSYAAVIMVGVDGQPERVLVLAASNRAAAKSVAANYLRWKFKQRLGMEILRPGIFKEIPVKALLYTHRTITPKTPRRSFSEQPMDVFFGTPKPQDGTQTPVTPHTSR